MKVFISWSGERSRQVAELLNTWIQCVIQAVDPWVSSQNLDRGTLWFSEISNQLANTTYGIICLTKSNKEKPWILFEAGALAKGLSSSRVFTFLIDLYPQDIEDPLAQFNHTLPNKDGLTKLIYSINNSLEAKRLTDIILTNVIETYWPQFEKEFKKIIEETPEKITTKPRSQDDILTDVLNSVRNLEKRMRNDNVEKAINPTSREIKRIKMPSLRDIQLELHKDRERADIASEIREMVLAEVPDEDIIKQYKESLNEEYIKNVILFEKTRMKIN
jgi:hypothetical protein